MVGVLVVVAIALITMLVPSDEQSANDGRERSADGTTATDCDSTTGACATASGHHSTTSARDMRACANHRNTTGRRIHHQWFDDE